MKMEKKLNDQISNEAQNEKTLEKFIKKVDSVKIEKIKKELENYKKSLDGKEYAVALDSKLLSEFEVYMTEKVEWKAKESLGVKEILKRIESCKKEGIKDGICYFTNLEVEASHYFLMKWEGKGSKEIDKFITLWKVFEESLTLIYQDNAKVKDLEKELAAAEQGIEAE